MGGLIVYKYRSYDVIFFLLQVGVHVCMYLSIPPGFMWNRFLKNIYKMFLEINIYFWSRSAIVGNVFLLYNHCGNVQAKS